MAFPRINITPACFQLVSEMGSLFLPFLCLKRAHLCSYVSSVYSSVDHKLQELLQCRSPPPHPCAIGRARVAGQTKRGSKEVRTEGEEEAELLSLIYLRSIT